MGFTMLKQMYQVIPGEKKLTNNTKQAILQYIS